MVKTVLIHKSFQYSMYDNEEQYLSIFQEWNKMIMIKQDENLWFAVSGWRSSGELLFGLVSLFNGISTPFRLFNTKAIILEEQ